MSSGRWLGIKLANKQLGHQEKEADILWFAANEIVANTTYTGVDATGRAIAKVPANASTDFFIDVVGYYA